MKGLCGGTKGGFMGCSWKTPEASKGNGGADTGGGGHDEAPIY